jgi:hypothetical protein
VVGSIPCRYRRDLVPRSQQGQQGDGSDVGQHHRVPERDAIADPNATALDSTESDTTSDNGSHTAPDNGADAAPDNSRDTAADNSRDTAIGIQYAADAGPTNGDASDPDAGVTDARSAIDAAKRNGIEPGRWPEWDSFRRTDCRRPLSV